MTEKRKEAPGEAPATSPGWEDFLVIDSLEVGPVRLQANKVSCPYRVRQGSEASEIEFVLRYEEDVFDPEEPESQNLAALIAAQVALNYGLFCREIHFRGIFDAADRHFLEAATENTAREIYVNKLLHPTPFLLPGWRNLQPVKRNAYNQARLLFDDPLPGSLAAWQTSPREHAVLSSGGKDSLLSFGLLRDIGQSVHPIFGNESGRHWFTALNAFRHFRETIPHTARVWMNSDRVFSWMVRHLPFIRSDFSSVRADEYPIRLWTVAVFLFSALPVVRKRRIGRLSVGNEFDTTVRKRYEGISHYAGLFDQSRFFDHMMTRYFQRKKWGLEQFSILRPLSELLIQNILVKRYPRLQEEQVSCHAAHKEGDRIRPCGRCEKCRRIVAMLEGLGEDPSLCGYRPDQIRYGLDRLLEVGLHQEKVSEQHLIALLSRMGKIKLPAARVAVPRPEVMAMRFDSERAAFSDIPERLREPLFKIMIEYASGALERRGRKWVPLDLFSDRVLREPYRFSRMQEPPDREANGYDYLLAELTWPEAEKRFHEVDVAILPVGAIEQHGPHLPLDTDAFDAAHLAQQVALHCAPPRPLVLPVISYGVSYHHMDFPGTISISNETLAKVVYEVGISLAKHGITKLVIINGHGGNDPALNFAAQQINRDAHIFACVDSGETSDVDIYAMTETPNDVHAGEIETSTALATRSHLVHSELFEPSVPKFSSRYLNFTSQRGISWHSYTHRISKTGVMGDPTRASEDKGHRIWELMIEHLVHFVEDLKGLTLDEIFQRRY